ncbi:MAG: hypothetical protein MHM6MM_003087 [Cercozoa sp. M6MM]
MKPEVQALMRQRDALEGEITSLLQTIPPEFRGVDRHSMPPLVDAEGFPRSDIDVYLIRTVRHKVAMLQNDYRRVMRQLEQHVLNWDSSGSRATTSASDVRSAEEKTEDALEHPRVPSNAAEMRAFALIDEVSADSPAFSAGLQVNDHVIQFGSLTDTFDAAVLAGTVRALVFPSEIASPGCRHCALQREFARAVCGATRQRTRCAFSASSAMERPRTSRLSLCSASVNCRALGLARLGESWRSL